jgi:hypothetical protein
VEVEPGLADFGELSILFHWVSIGSRQSVTATEDKNKIKKQTI